MLFQRNCGGMLLQALMGSWMVSSCWGLQQEETFSSIPEAAEELAPRIAKSLHQQSPPTDRPLEVAVLAFGDGEGKVAEDLFFASKTLQGELVAQLRNLGSGKFLVWDPNRLKKKAEETGADLKKLSVQDFKAAAGELKKLGLDVAIVGSYQVESNNQHARNVNVHSDILLASGRPLQVAAKAESLEPPAPWMCDAVSTRFSVDVLVDGKPLPMYVEFIEQIGGLARRICLDLNRQTHYGKPFTIRLQNHGWPPAGWLEKTEYLERGRFFCAAVFVDGVSSIYEKGPDGEFHPSQRHPDNVTKWVLTTPGVAVQAGYDTRNYTSKHVRNVGGLGGSVVEIPGFQVNDQTAASFEFADAGESHAHDVGLTKDIGLISVYFYAEQLPGDIEWFPPGQCGAGAGVRLGQPIPNEVSRVCVRTHVQPVEIWNIYYRYRGEGGSVDTLRTAGKNMVPIQVAKADMKRRFRDEERQFGGVFRARKEYERMLRSIPRE